MCCSTQLSLELVLCSVVPLSNEENHEVHSWEKGLSHSIFPVAQSALCLSGKHEGLIAMSPL